MTDPMPARVSPMPAATVFDLGFGPAATVLDCARVGFELKA